MLFAWPLIPLPAQQPVVLSERPASSCRVGRVVQTPLTIGRNHPIYVESHAFISSPTSKLLLAGAPSYEWVRASSDEEVRDSQVLALVLSPAGVATAIRSPIEKKRLADVRAVWAEGSKWAIIFGEKSAPQLSMKQEIPITRYWFGIAEGVALGRLEKLPMPNGEITELYASRLVKHRDGYSIAVRVRYKTGERGVAIFSRRHGKWAVHEHRTSVAYVALDTTKTGTLVLGVVRADSTEIRDSNSFFAYDIGMDGSRWDFIGRLVRGGASPVDHPKFLWVGPDLAATWTSPSLDGTGVDAKLLMGIPSRNLPLTVMSSPEPKEVFVIPIGDAPSIQILVTATEAGPGRIVLSVLSQGKISHLTSMVSPFVGSIGVAALRNEIFLNGATSAFTKGKPAVASLQVRISLLCS